MYEVKKSSTSNTLSILTVFLVSLPVSVMMLFIMVSDGLIRFVFRLFLLYIKNQIHILYYDVINPDHLVSNDFECAKNTALAATRQKRNGISCTEESPRNTCEHSMQPRHYYQASSLICG